MTMYVHKHWMLGFKTLFWPSLSFLASWAFLYVAPFLVIFYAVAVWSVFSLVWWIRNFMDYYLDAWLLTDQAIIDVKWHGWFHRTSTRILYSDVQGVSYEIKGIASTLLRYGDIAVEKVSTGGKVWLEDIPHPRVVEMQVLNNMEHYMHTKNLKDAKRVQEILATVVAREVHLDGLQSKKSASRSS